MQLTLNRIGDEGAKALANNTSLTSLYLELSRIGHEGVKALANNTSLTSLCLSSNNIDHEGAKALANNTSLTSLDLRGNRIGDEGAKALANNTSLTSLILYNNKIGDEGAKALANNISLTSLGLQANNIGNEGVCAFKEALKEGRNQRLLSLELPQRLPDDIQETLRYNKNQNLRRHKEARELLRLSRITLLSASNTSQNNTLGFSTLPEEMKWEILAAAPEGELLSKRQKHKVIQFASDRKTLNKHTNFLSFLKTTGCQYSELPSCALTPNSLCKNESKKHKRDISTKW